jgi:hypothetical protein
MMRKSVRKAARASRRDQSPNGTQRGTQWGTRRPQRRALAAAVASCLMMGTPAVLAQSANSNLRGLVTSESGPAANTEVVATNTATGVIRRTQTDAQGRYVLVGLPPGT